MLGYSTVEQSMESSIETVYDLLQSASGAMANSKIVHAHGRRQ